MGMTKVGKESDFETAIQNLVELDYDAIEAYNMAINKLENMEFKGKLETFKKDHERHVKEFSDLLRKHNVKVPAGPDIKQWLTKGKVVIGTLLGDNAILSAMISNEYDTNAAYENLNNRDDIWEDAKEILKQGLKDERTHKAWLESTKSANQSERKSENVDI